MSVFTERRCFVHPVREAAGLCVSCRRSFCRECLVDHDHRLMCGSCVAQTVRDSGARPHSRARLLGIAALPVALLIAWAAVYVAGRILLLNDTTRHVFQQNEAVGSRK